MTGQRRHPAEGADAKRKVLQLLQAAGRLQLAVIVTLSAFSVVQRLGCRGLQHAGATGIRAVGRRRQGADVSFEQVWQVVEAQVASGRFPGYAAACTPTPSATRSPSS